MEGVPPIHRQWCKTCPRCAVLPAIVASMTEHSQRSDGRRWAAGSFRWPPTAFADSLIIAGASTHRVVVRPALHDHHWGGLAKPRSTTGSRPGRPSRQLASPSFTSGRFMAARPGRFTSRTEPRHTLRAQSRCRRTSSSLQRVGCRDELRSSVWVVPQCLRRRDDGDRGVARRGRVRRGPDRT